MEPEWNTVLIMDKLKEETSNNYCFDCGSTDSDWASVNNGIFLCLNCAGKHRGLGVQISFVRSTKIDEWQEKQLKQMYYGGNSALNDFLDTYSLPKSIESYKTKAVQYYRDSLKAKSENILLESEAPDLQTGQEPLQEAQGVILALRNMENLSVQQILEKFWLDAKEFSKNLSDKIKDITFEEIKEKTSELIHDLTAKVESFDYKGTFTDIKTKSSELYDSIKESTKHTIEHPGETFREKFESSKVTVIETFEKSKAKVIETYENSKEIIKENYNYSVEKVSGSEIVIKAKSMLGK